METCCFRMTTVLVLEQHLAALRPCHGQLALTRVADLGRGHWVLRARVVVHAFSAGC